MKNKTNGMDTRNGRQRQRPTTTMMLMMTMSRKNSPSNRTRNRQRNTHTKLKEAQKLCNLLVVRSCPSFMCYYGGIEVKKSSCYFYNRRPIQLIFKSQLFILFVLCRRARLLDRYIDRDRECRKTNIKQKRGERPHPFIIQKKKDHITNTQNERTNIFMIVIILLMIRFVVIKPKSGYPIQP